MKAASGRWVFFLTYITIAGSLWTASEWLEKGLAERSGEPDISPGGCYRVELFKPLWVLPMMFHSMPHPDSEVPRRWLPWWEYPAFFRLYDHRTGELISETEVYDLASASGPLDWGDGSGEVSAGMILIGPNLPDCLGDRPTPVSPQ
ncbi:hypothetical protein ALQ57_05194 [Pseudomonas amygdali pv. hibisci]|uniref:Uncharacterized protein n=1 Tax=Pseudomonas amygdali pv. hibisci TaxID=251723 RepID=A0AB34U4T9_PSEA0|nr:Uncharacterized protein ALO67_05273 [Pseudomonas amygdali pv. hibisci]QED85694.1 hypothetical protein PSYTB_19495 [Pseudomonas amygdali pv. tabaci str. ATCC 11528]RMN59296.1 hypothetical protein ALQ57_05194 [Pseudomonas amygdali pv. hibisci]